MENKNVTQNSADTKTSKKRNPFLTFLFGFLNAILIVFLSLWIELTIGTVFISEISKDIDYEQFFVIDFLDINEFIQSVAPLVICIVFVVITTALIFVTNLKKIRTSFLSIGISFAVCSAINAAIGLLCSPVVKLLPFSFQEMVLNKVPAFESLISISAFPLLLIASLFISIFLVVNFVKQSKKKKKSFKRNVIGLVISFICVALFFVAISFIILIPKKSTEDVIESELTVSFRTLADENKEIDFNEEKGLLYINNEVIVIAEVDADISDIEALADKQDAYIDESMADIGIYKFTFSGAMEYEDLETKISKLKKSEFVKDAYLNIVTTYETDTVGDPVYPKDNWNGDNWNVDVPRGKNWGMEAIEAPRAWSYLDQMQTVRIGEIDNFPNTKHEDLVNMFGGYSCLCVTSGSGKTDINAYSIPTQDHGTHVAGIMNAEWNNGKGVSGVMGGKGELYYAAVYFNGSKYLDYGTSYSYLLSLKTLIYQDVQVINISQNTNRLIGFAASHGNKNAIDFLTQQADVTEIGLSRIISNRQALGEKDFVICVAAGNSNNTYYYKDDSQTYGYREDMTFFEWVQSWFGWTGEKGDSLALYNNFLNLMDSDEVKNRVIVVGAVGIDYSSISMSGTRYNYASYSNVGSRVDIVAPGTEIYSCYASGYDDMSGTSMATPHVSGVAGLVFACNPDLSGPQVKAILMASTVGRYYFHDGSGGMVNARIAVENALETKNIPVERVIQSAEAGGLDLCFVVDTTGSMGDDIDNAKANMTDILSHLSEKTSDYRVAIIDYRDFPSRTGDYNDYPARVQLDFSSNDSEIESAINRLGLGYGGDEEETVYSGLMAAVDLDWRPTAKKVIIVLGDAAPLDPEPETGYTYDDVLNALRNADIDIDYGHSDSRVTDSLEYSAITVYAIGTSASYDAADFFEDISLDTGGGYASVADASGVSDAIIDSIEQIEITAAVSAKADFGDALADKTVDVYQGGEYLFSIETDENGSFEIDNIEPDMYHWECPEMLTSGSMEIDSGDKFASIRTKQNYWFNPMISTWSDQKTKIVPVSELIALFILFVPLLIAMAIVKLADSMRAKRAAAPKPAPVSQPVAATQPAAVPAPTTAATTAVETAPPQVAAMDVAISPIPAAVTPEATAATTVATADDEIVAPKSKIKKKKDAQIEFITCPNCGKALESSDKFCGYCGITIDNKNNSIE